MMKYNMEKAILASKQSKCNRNKVGAVIIKDGRTISDGFNGTISGFCNNCEDGNSTKDEVVHAEENAIAFAAKYGISTKGASLYVTLSPCIRCAKLIIQSGISEVIYLEKYRDISGIELLTKAGLDVKQYKEID